MYSKEELLQDITPRLIGGKLFVFESIDSTNTCGKTLAEAGIGEGTVVFADHQTAGKGRNGRTWLSEPGSNLLFSVVVRPELPKDQTSFLTFYSAVSIARAVELVIGHAVECKWPNDFLLNSRKFCGILLESSFGRSKLDYSVIGVGVNVNQQAFNGEMRHPVTSLSLEEKTRFDIKQLFQKIVLSLDELYVDVQSRNFQTIMKEWNSRCSMFGKPVTVERAHDRLSGTAIGLSADGGLMIETPEGTSTVYAGDVSILQES